MSAFFFYIVLIKHIPVRKITDFKTCSPMTVLQTGNFSMALQVLSVKKLLLKFN